MLPRVAGNPILRVTENVVDKCRAFSSFAHAFNDHGEASSLSEPTLMTPMVPRNQSHPPNRHLRSPLRSIGARCTEMQDSDESPAAASTAIALASLAALPPSTSSMPARPKTSVVNMPSYQPGGPTSIVHLASLSTSQSGACHRDPSVDDGFIAPSPE